MKRLRTSEKDRVRNKARIASIKTNEKKLRTAVAAGQVDQARAFLVETLAKLDKAVKAGTIHRNKSARKKAQFSKLMAEIAKTAE
jgi:small subunit ribosomal protein S20